MARTLYDNILSSSLPCKESQCSGCPGGMLSRGCCVEVAMEGCCVEVVMEGCCVGLQRTVERDTVLFVFLP